MFCLENYFGKPNNFFVLFAQVLDKIPEIIGTIGNNKEQVNLDMSGDTSGSEDSGVSSPGVPGVPWPPQILADQLTLSQPEGKDYANLITTGTSRLSDLPTALLNQNKKSKRYGSG